MEREARFSGARNTRDDREFMARNRHIDILQVMLASAMHLNIQRQIFAAFKCTIKVAIFAMLFRKYRRQIATCLRLLAFGNLLRRSRGNHLTAMNTRIRAQVDACRGS